MQRIVSFIKEHSRIFYVLAAVVILIEVVWAYFSILKPAPVVDQTIPPQTEEEKGKDAKLNFSGPNTATIGATFKVDVILSTQKPTGGADLILKYDPNMLELIPNNNQAVSPGKIYQEYPVNEVDPKQGKITLIGLTSPQSKGFVGQDVLATLTFKAKSKEETTLSIDFTKGSTTDSNVSEEGSGVDLLNQVSKYTVNVE